MGCAGGPGLEPRVELGAGALLGFSWATWTPLSVSAAGFAHRLSPVCAAGLLVSAGWRHGEGL